MPVDPGSTSMEEFHKRLAQCHRIVALCGAGLSVASGVPSAVPLQHTQKAMHLDTFGVFEENPGAAWLYYSVRRHTALVAKPNAAHKALVTLAKKNSNFICLSQNIDGLHLRAGHPPEQLITFHGSLFDLKCMSTSCGYIDYSNYTEPLCPVLSEACEDGAQEKFFNKHITEHKIPKENLPNCPKCKTGLLRPAVIRFREEVDDAPLEQADVWINAQPVDMILVIGTQARVRPAASYVEKARKAGATLVVVNTSIDQLGTARDLKVGDFYFIGDAEELVPKLLEPIIGKKETIEADGLADL